MDLMLHWFKNRVLMRKPIFGNSFIDGVRVNAGFSRPLGNSFGFPKDSQPDIIPGVVLLLNQSCPIAIFWAVVSVVISTLQSHSIWAFAHIVDKVFKVLPSFTDLYSTPSVPFKRLVFFNGASPPHVIPRLVFCGSRKTMFGCHGCHPSTSEFRGQTSAGFGLPFQIRNANSGGIPAIADTLPEVDSPPSSIASNHHQSSESFSGQILSRTIDRVVSSDDHLFSFLHSISMFGVSEPPATTGGFRVSSYLSGGMSQ